MKLGPLIVECHGFSPQHMVLSNNQQQYYESIDSLCRLLEDVPWVLAGGLAVPFTLGAFFRRHSDIDIMIPIESLSSVCKKFQAGGYKFFKRIIVSHHSRSLVIRYPIDTIAKIVPNLNCAMIRITGKSKYKILDKIDIHPYEIKDGILISDYRGPTIKINNELLSNQISTGHGTQFKCLSLPYVSWLKQSRQSLKHHIDLIAITNGVDAAILQVKQSA